MTITKLIDRLKVILEQEGDLKVHFISDAEYYPEVDCVTIEGIGEDLDNLKNKFILLVD